MATVHHRGFELGTADGEHARAGADLLVEHAAQDFQRGEHLAHCGLDTQPFELGLHAGGAGPRVVGEEGHGPALAPQEGEHLGRPWHEDIARPHAAIEIEDETA